MRSPAAKRLDGARRLSHDLAMATGAEGIGEAVTGGLAARAVESSAGERRGREPLCLNCRTPLAGAYCHACGQPGHVHRTISAWWHDLAHGVLHLDGKIFRTLPLLAIWPGDLTRRYVDGERARFVSPLALFLFSVFLMFALFSILGAPVIGAPEEASKEIAAEVQTLETRIAALEEERGKAADPKRIADIDGQVADLKVERNAIAASEKYLVGGSNAAKLKTGWPRLDRGIKKANENPALLFYKLQTNAYKFSWALIPLSVPFLWLLFLHRRRYRQQYKAYDHLVFVTYSIAFMSLAAITLVSLYALGLGGNWMTVAILLLPPVHIYRQLRGAYRLSRLSALWRTAALLFFSAVALTLFLLLLLAVGVLG